MRTTSSFPVSAAIGLEIMTMTEIPTTPATTAVRAKTVCIVMPDDSSDHARIAAVSGICNDEPSWDDFMRSLTDYQREKDAEYLESMSG